MARVTGIGGIFFKTRDRAAMIAWYRDHLGMEPSGLGSVAFHWAGEKNGVTVWGPFESDTRYFEPSTARFMINYRVDDLDGMLAKLRAAGVSVDDKVEEYDYGRFGWIMDPEGNRLELWEPTDVPPE